MKGKTWDASQSREFWGTGIENMNVKLQFDVLVKDGRINPVEDIMKNSEDCLKPM